MPDLKADQFEHEKAQLTAIRTTIAQICGSEFAGDLDPVALADKLARAYHRATTERNIAQGEAERLQRGMDALRKQIKQQSQPKD